MARIGLGKKAERGNYFLKPKFGSSLPALMFSICRGQAVRAGEENANLLESAQNLFSEEPRVCDSIQFNCILGKRKSCLPRF